MVTDRRVAVVLAAAAAVVSGTVATAWGHERPEGRRLILSVERDRVELLVAWSVRSGRVANELQAAIDHDHSGRADRASERLAQAQLLLPRVERGIEVHVSGQRRILRPVDFRFRNGSLEGAGRGLEGLVHYDAGPSFEARAALSVDVVYRGHGAAVLEVQGGHGVGIVAAPGEEGPRGPLAGPFELRRGNEGASFRLAQVP